MFRHFSEEIIFNYEPYLLLYTTKFPERKMFSLSRMFNFVAFNAVTIATCKFNFLLGLTFPCRVT